MPQERVPSVRSASPLRALAFAAALGAVAGLAVPAAASAASIAVPQSIASAGKIVFCSDISSPPVEFVNPSTMKPTGSDIDIGDALAKRFGVRAEWRNVPFKGIIPALLAHQCDAIISQLFDKPARRKVIDLIDYMNSSEALLVRAGNPHGIHSLDDLSGRKVAVENGTTILDLIQAQNKKFAAAGEKKAEIVVYPTDTDALQALQIGQVEVYGTTLESGAYYTLKQPKVFALAGPAFHHILTAIGVRKDDPELAAAIRQGIASMRADGSLLAILKKWHMEGDMLK